MTQETNDSKHLKKEMSLLDILYILIKYKKYIIRITFLIMVITFGITLLLPKWYKSTVVVLLPEKGTSPFDILSSGTGINLSTFGLGSITNSQRYIAILNSRRLREDVIYRFNMMESFKANNIEVALKTLDGLLNSEVNVKQGTIEIEMMYMEDPDSAAVIADYIVRKLDDINKELSTEQARSNRIFIEKQYYKAKAQLRSSEDSLNVFQKKYGVLSITEQTKVTIEAASEIYKRKIETETEYNILKNDLGQNHPEVTRLHAKVMELNKLIKNINQGDEDFKIFIPFNLSADLGMAYLRFYREVQIQTKIIEFLTPQYEQAKIQEAKDTPTLLVLDSAKPALRHTKPKKMTYTLFIGLITFFMCCIIATLYELSKQNKSLDDENRAKINYIFNQISLKNILK